MSNVGIYIILLLYYVCGAMNVYDVRTISEKNVKFSLSADVDGRHTF